MIEAIDIHLRQGGLTGLSLTIEMGTVTAVLGPNGAGKSTLLDVLAGRSRVDAGMVRLGERQRVQLARVIAQIWHPPGSNGSSKGPARMLLLDEPTASLDPGHRLAVMRLLRDLAATGIGVLIALHDLNDALHFADQVLLLKRGCLHSAGKPATVLTSAALSAVYDAPTEVVRLADGRSVVVFG